MANAAPSSSDSSNSTAGFCERELILKLLGEKRSLLGKIHEERKENQRWKTECLQLREENEKLQRDRSKEKTTECPQDSYSESSTDPRGSSSKQDDCSDTELRSLHKKIGILETKIHDFKRQNGVLTNQKSVLEAEVLRLANSLRKNDPELETELLKEQLLLYEEDFAKEKNDKVSAEGKLSSLHEQIRDCQELISNLNIEVDMYKRAYKREKGEKETILVQNADKKFLQQLPLSTGAKYQIPRQRTLPKPQLQVVYPVLDSQEQESEQRRRHQLQRVGVFSRNVPQSPTNLPTYYGGDVETDCFWHS